MKIDTTLYLVTDSGNMTEETFLNKIESACEGGITLLQLREKERSAREYLSLARKVKKIVRRYNIPLLIDDRIDIALAADADGVHVGQSDIPVADARKILGPGKIIGATAKTAKQAVEAFRQGADYIGAGAVYPTGTKKDTWQISPSDIRAIVQAVPIPVNAIGGLNRNNLEILSDTGIAGICVVSALMQAPQPMLEAWALRAAFFRLKGRSPMV